MDRSNQRKGLYNVVHWLVMHFCQIGNRYANKDACLKALAIRFLRVTRLLLHIRNFSDLNLTFKINVLGTALSYP